MNSCNMKRWMAGASAVLAVAGLAALQSGCGQQAPQGPAWDFARIDARGAVLPDEHAGEHQCVLDRRTGLFWEVKQAAPGLHHRDDLFSWHSADAAEHGGEPGLADGGRCGLARCDTGAYVEAVNQATLCGLADWRMPSRDEALTLLDSARIGKGPTLDPRYFPGTVGAEYWTGTTFRLYPQGAWAIDTIYGQDRVDWKTSLKHVRLVSGSKTAVRPKGRGR
jgi:chitinase